MKKILTIALVTASLAVFASQSGGVCPSKIDGSCSVSGWEQVGPKNPDTLPYAIPSYLPKTTRAILGISDSDQGMNFVTCRFSDTCSLVTALKKKPTLNTGWTPDDKHPSSGFGNLYYCTSSVCKW